MPSSQPPNQLAAEIETIVAGIFKKAGWRVRRHPAIGDLQADLLLESADKRYVVEVKGLSEGRSDRLLPLLAQAILQAQAFARRFPEAAQPLAVVAARRVPPSVVEHLIRFAARYAPDVSIGVIDLEGLRAFVGAGLERLNERPRRRKPEPMRTSQRLPDLFSDLNQWMLKILLGQRLPAALIAVPRQPIRNASELAGVAAVSVMSASRFLHQLANQGFLEEGAEELQVVRVGELLDRWISANRNTAQELPARWIIRKGPAQIISAVREYLSPIETSPAKTNKARIGPIREGLPRCCVGLFSAADALGFSLVHGVPPHIYLERVTPDALLRLGVTIGQSDRPPDLYIRVPANREAIFRSCVSRERIQVADILQVWLDVSTHPKRGREQALEIQRQVLTSIIGKER